MTWNDVWMITSAVIVSCGGAGAIIVGAASFLASTIEKRLEMKYRQFLDKELESYKSALENKRYITKAQFDREFEIYGQLSKAFFALQIKLSTISHDDCYKERSTKKETLDCDTIVFEGLIKAADAAQNALFENAAFLPEHIFLRYENIFELANDQFWIFKNRLEDYYDGKIAMSDRLTQSDKDRYSTLEKEIRSLNNDLRKYLSTLSVLE